MHRFGYLEEQNEKFVASKARMSLSRNKSLCCTCLTTNDGICHRIFCFDLTAVLKNIVHTCLSKVYPTLLSVTQQLNSTAASILKQERNDQIMESPIVWYLSTGIIIIGSGFFKFLSILIMSNV